MIFLLFLSAQITNNRNNNTKYTTDNHKTQQGTVNGMMSDHTIYDGLIIYDTNN